MSKALFSIYKSILKSTLFIFIAILSCQSQAKDFPNIEHQSLTVWSQGSRLAGDIYRPKGLAPTGKLP